jgi:hypothetical protein
MDGQCPDQGVDQYIQVFPEVVSGLDPVTTVTIDKNRQIGGQHRSVLEHIGTVLEITDPQIMGMIAAPAFTDLFFQHPQLETGGARLLEMPVEGGSGDCRAVQLFKKTIDRLRTAIGLLFFKLDGFCDDRTGNVAGFTAIRAALSGQGVKASLAVAVEFAAQSGKGRFCNPPVRKADIGLGQFFKKLVGQLRGDLVVNDLSEQITPENSPLFLRFVH